MSRLPASCQRLLERRRAQKTNVSTTSRPRLDEFLSERAAENERPQPQSGRAITDLLRMRYDLPLDAHIWDVVLKVKEEETSQSPGESDR